MATRPMGASSDDKNAKTHLLGKKTKQWTGAEPGTKIDELELDSGESYPSEQDASATHPIVGFLVSVSRTGLGEYWVLRQGQNMIGSEKKRMSDGGTNNNCIVLNEEKVSGEHALLAVQRDPDDNRLYVGLRDMASGKGTLVNGKSIRFSTYECQNFDKIKIGNYELLLMLFDYAEHGLEKSKDFKPKMAANDDDDDDSNQYNFTGDHTQG